MDERMSALEALANAVIGLLVSWAVTVFVLGFSWDQAAAITAGFFGLSFTRAYVIRRVFKWLIERK
jgi:hypothetical protein